MCFRFPNILEGKQTFIHVFMRLFEVATYFVCVCGGVVVGESVGGGVREVSFPFK